MSHESGATSYNYSYTSPAFTVINNGYIGVPVGDTISIDIKSDAPLSGHYSFVGMASQLPFEITMSTLDQWFDPYAANFTYTIDITFEEGQPVGGYFIKAGVYDYRGEMPNYMVLSSLHGSFSGSPSFAGEVRQYYSTYPAGMSSAAFGYKTTGALGAWSFSSDEPQLPVPEHGASTMALLGLGVGGLVAYGRRRRNTV